MCIRDRVLSVPDVKYAATVAIPTLLFKVTCKNLSALGDTCALSCDDDALTLKVSGDGGECTETFASSDLCIRASAAVHASYALRYLNLFCKVLVADGLLLKAADDVPLCVEQAFGAQSWIRFFLAPKMED